MLESAYQIEINYALVLVKIDRSETKNKRFSISLKRTGNQCGS